MWESRSLPKLFETPSSLFKDEGVLFAENIFFDPVKSLDGCGSMIYNCAPLLGKQGYVFCVMAQKKIKKRLTGRVGLDKLPSCRFVLAEQKAGL